MKLRRRGVLPGFNLTLGYTVFYVGLLVILPLLAMVLKASTNGLGAFVSAVTDERALQAYKLSFATALAGAAINALFGVVVAWVLARYTFPGKSLLDALVDLPFALPTAVAGIALTAVYSENAWLGGQLMDMGVKVAFTQLGIIVALTFIGIPFVVRTVQPVLEELDTDVEEAAAILGADRFQTFRRVILPSLLPA
ncbi:MAG TPA: sulfate ABC transporter permease subunit CysT, partial [Polyangiaceae bacterium]|nr:sulfate ABC transporter permease subunit CysT [Polyangiaceae bacterium]